MFVPQSFDGAELKAGGRFFDYSEVDTDGMLNLHFCQTLGRMRQVPVVLAVLDTTEFSPSHLPATKGLRYGTNQISNDKACLCCQRIVLVGG